jgi:hypothetical protein
MLTRKTVLKWLALAVMGATAIGGALFEPTGIVRGVIRKESFFRHRPTSYWREVLRADGQAGRLSPETLETFGELDAIPILRKCATDVDADVRWPATVLIQQIGSIEDVIGVLSNALNDSDQDIRLTAIRGLGHQRREALSELPKLVELTKDPDPLVKTQAHWALWEIDQTTALNIVNWPEFQCEKWRFRAAFPGIPEVATKMIETSLGPVPSETYSVSFGSCYFAVAVTDYTPRKIDTRLQDLADHLADQQFEAKGGEIEQDEPITLDGHLGREEIVYIRQRGSVIRTRRFAIGSQLFNIVLGRSRKQFSPQAELYFLNSLHIDIQPEESIAPIDGGSNDTDGNHGSVDVKVPDEH